MRSICVKFHFNFTLFNFCFKVRLNCFNWGKKKTSKTVFKVKFNFEFWLENYFYIKDKMNKIVLGDCSNTVKVVPASATGHLLDKIKVKFHLNRVFFIFLTS